MFVWLRHILFRTFQGGYAVTPSTIRLWQRHGVVEIPRSQIEAVKVRSVRHVIVRLRGGRRLVLNPFDLSLGAFNAVTHALRESLATNLTNRPGKSRRRRDV